MLTNSHDAVPDQTKYPTKCCTGSQMRSSVVGTTHARLLGLGRHVVDSRNWFLLGDEWPRRVASWLASYTYQALS